MAQSEIPVIQTRRLDLILAVALVLPLAGVGLYAGKNAVTNAGRAMSTLWNSQKVDPAERQKQLAVIKESNVKSAQEVAALESKVKAAQEAAAAKASQATLPDLLK